MRYLRYILLGFVFALAWFLSAILITPLNYFIKDWVRDNNIYPLWIFLNDTTKGEDAGDYGRFKHNFMGFYQQNAIRNSHWNLKLLVSPKVGKKENLKGKLTWRNYNIKGWQFAIYEIKESKYFRWSYSAGWFYFQFGASHNRYIYKVKNRLWSIIVNKIKI